MKRFVIFSAVVMSTLAAHAEWYTVTKIIAYNKIEAHVSKGASSKNNIVIRIHNLENIEYIQNDRSKVMLGSSAPKDLLTDLLRGHMVWVDQLETESGEYVAHVYPSYEQIIRVFTKRHMSGSYTIDPGVKQKLVTIHRRMLSSMKSTSPPRGGTPVNGKEKNTMSYENDYAKTIFVYDALNWFKKTGQFLPSIVQDLYIDWVGDYQQASGVDARNLEIRIKDLQKRSDQYRDFLFED